MTIGLPTVNFFCGLLELKVFQFIVITVFYLLLSTNYLPQSISSEPSVQSICLSHFQLSDIQVASEHSNSFSLQLKNKRGFEGVQM